MITIAPRQHPFRRFSKVAALAALAAALSAGGVSAQHANEAAEPAFQLASASLDHLEDAFWACDYKAAAHGPAGTDMTLCAAVYEAFKQRKFGGDFEKLLGWWQQNKVARHHALAAVDSRQVSR